MVKFDDVPGQPLSVGVKVMVPEIFDPLEFAGAFHCGILPVPLANIPIAVFEFVHVKEEPEGVLLKLPILIGFPGQTVMLEIVLATGVG